MVNSVAPIRDQSFPWWSRCLQWEYVFERESFAHENWGPSCVVPKAVLTQCRWVDSRRDSNFWFFFSLIVFIPVFSKSRHAATHGSGCQIPMASLKEYLSAFLSPSCFQKKKRPAAWLLFQCNFWHEEIKQLTPFWMSISDCQREETNCGCMWEHVSGHTTRGAPVTFFQAAGMLEWLLFSFFFWMD